ncbi:MAG: heme ABC transporter ATP-binding protein [Aureispira sp.]
MNNSSILTARDLQVNLGRHTILRNINLELSAGQILTVLGGNGAGKSTLLRALAQQIPYQKGAIILQGQALKEWSVNGLAQERAVLSQYSTLVFPMSVIDVVLLGRYPFSKGAPTTKDWAIVEDLMEHLGILKYAHKNILNLSGGEQQRVHLARVLAQVWDSTWENPKLLFLDEPTSSLDIAYQHELLQLVQEQTQENGLAVLAILHDMNLAARYASHVALLKKGQLIQQGIPSETLTNHWIQQAFGVAAVVQEHPIFDCLQISTY